MLAVDCYNSDFSTRHKTKSLERAIKIMYSFTKHQYTNIDIHFKVMKVESEEVFIKVVGCLETDGSVTLNIKELN